MASAREVANLVPMAALLVRAGFRLRSATRADCARCTGRSQGTVAFTGEVAFCHRCKWRASTVTLAGELGLLGSDPETRAALREAANCRARDSELPLFAEGRR